MKLFFKRLSVYWLCFFVCYLPYRQVQAALPLAAVVLDVVAGSALAVAADTIITKAICGKKPWGANDPVFACNAKTPKSTWKSKALGSAKWGALFAAASYLVSDSGVFDTDKQSSGDLSCKSNTGSGAYGRSKTVDGCLAMQQAAAKASGSEYVGLSGGMHRWKSVNSQNPYHSGNLYISDYDMKRFGLSVPEDQFVEDFWKTSPDVPASTWLPDSTPEVPDPIHPDPDFFPTVEPVTTPYTPSPSYPQTLPDSHPDKRPTSDPKPDYGDFPFDLPGSWPSDWPEPGSVPVSPGDFPLEWPLPGSTPLPDPTPTPDPTPDPDKPTDPDIPVDPSPLPNPLPVIGPLTRTEFEQVQAKNFSEATSNLPDPNFQKHEDEITKAMNDFIADSVDVVVPEFGFNPFGYFSYGGGSCIAFSFNLSIGGKTKNVTFDSHCPPFEDYVRPTLEWSLYLSTGLYLYMMFTRTVRSL
ncbi:conserved hypothetical protein [Vibrio chagasii]|nr:conserved hypothetical protein [Vibrio chagasii]CAH7182181.1 conserved hypothetical protein [Vibrio chagasii]